MMFRRRTRGSTPSRQKPPAAALREASLESTITDEHDAVVDVLTDSAPPGSHDHERRLREESDEEEYLRGAGAVAVLRRGLAVTPELRQGVVLTVSWLSSPPRASWRSRS